MDDIFMALLTRIVDGDTYSINIFKSAGISTVNDIKMIDERTIGQIESYFTKVKYKLTKEEREKFLDVKGESFMFPPGIKRRMLQFSEKVKCIDTREMGNLGQVVLSMCDKLGIAETNEIRHFVDDIQNCRSISSNPTNSIDPVVDDIQNCRRISSNPTNSIDPVVDNIDLTNDEINCEQNQNNVTVNKKEHSNVLSEQSEAQIKKTCVTSDIDSSRQRVIGKEKIKEARIVLTHISPTLLNRKRKSLSNTSNNIARKSTPIHFQSTSQLCNDNFIQPIMPPRRSDFIKISSSHNRNQQNACALSASNISSHSRHGNISPFQETSKSHVNNQQASQLPSRVDTDNTRPVTNNSIQKENNPAVRSKAKLVHSNQPCNTSASPKNNPNVSTNLVQKFRNDNKNLITRYNLRKGTHFYIHPGANPKQAVFMCLMCTFESSQFVYDPSVNMYSSILEHIRFHVDNNDLKEQTRKSLSNINKSCSEIINDTQVDQKTPSTSTHHKKETPKQYKKAPELLDHLPFVSKQTNHNKSHNSNKRRKLYNSCNYVAPADMNDDNISDLVVKTNNTNYLNASRRKSQITDTNNSSKENDRIEVENILHSYERNLHRKRSETK